MIYLPSCGFFSGLVGERGSTARRDFASRLPLRSRPQNGSSSNPSPSAIRAAVPLSSLQLLIVAARRPFDLFCAETRTWIRCLYKWDDQNEGRANVRGEIKHSADW